MLTQVKLRNLRTNKEVILAKYPNLPSLSFKKGDKLAIQAMVANDEEFNFVLRIEMWIGNRLYASIGRDSVDHVSQKEYFIRLNDFGYLYKTFIIADRDLFGLPICAILINYDRTNHLTCKLKLVD